MRIGILSDTHGNLHFFEKAMEIIGDAEYIIHCGDIFPDYSGYAEPSDKEKIAQRIRRLSNMILVKGNGDRPSHEKMMERELFSPYHLIPIGGYTFFITHGHNFSRMQMIWKAKELGANILCYGHSHVKELDTDGEIILLNPGSTALPRDNSHSCAVIENGHIFMYNIETKEMIASLDIPF